MTLGFIIEQLLRKCREKKKKKAGCNGEVTEFCFSFICLLFASQP